MSNKNKNRGFGSHPPTAEEARKAGKKGAAVRWADKDPATKRSIRLNFSLSPEENALLNNKAEKLKISRTELIVQAIKDFNGKRKEQ